MRRDEAPEREAHAGAVAGAADDADQHAVEQHHVDRADACEHAGGAGGERHGDVVGSDRARRERLDRHDAVRPHLAARDRVHHLAVENEAFEAGIERGQEQPRRAAGDKQRECGERAGKCFAERARKSVGQEREHARQPRPGRSRVDEIVRAREQAVEVTRERRARRILTRGRQVRGGLPVQ